MLFSIIFLVANVQKNEYCSIIFFCTFAFVMFLLVIENVCFVANLLLQ